MELIDLKPLTAELFLFSSAMLLLVFGVFSAKRSDKTAKSIAILSIMTMIIALVILTISKHGAGGNEYFGFLYVTNTFANFSKQLILIGAILTLTMALPWLSKKENNHFEYGLLLMLSTAGLMLMVSADDFLSLYLGLELSSLALYVMAAISRDNLKSAEAGMKYFVLGSVASGMLLFGISLVYGFAGSTQFTALAGLLGSASFTDPLASGFPYGVVIGMVMVLVGICFKISAAPFHMWTPDVYEGSPTPVTAYFSTAPKAAAILLLARVLAGPFDNLFIYWQQVIIFVAVASMFIGAYGALTQRNIKRLLAYSSIGHVGYALIGLAAGNFEGTKAVIIYVTLYLFMSAGAFGCVLLMKRQGKDMESIDDLSGISTKHSVLALSIAILMFSMAGIPPLAGFFGKMYVFAAALEAELYYLAVFGLLMSVVSCFYYIRVVKIMYFNEPEEGFDAKTPLSMKLAIGVCILVTLGFVLKPGLLLFPAELAMQGLL